MKVKSSKIKVILLSIVAAIWVVGIISCSSGENITGSRSVSIDTDVSGEVSNPDGTGTIEPTTPEPTTPDGELTTNLPTWEKDKVFYDVEIPDVADNGKWDTGETKGKTFYGSSYRSVYIFGVSEPWTRVSYNDTDRLDRIWKNMIDRGIRDGKRRMYIKTSDGDFFFDENYNIRWSKKPDTVLKWFQGGVIAQLRQGYGNNVHSSTDYGGQYSGNFTIGGLYTFAMSLTEVTKFNSTRANEFFWANSSIKGYYDNTRFGGKMEVLVVHPGIPVDLGTGLAKVNGKGIGIGWTGTAYALQSYSAVGYGSEYADGNSDLYNIKGNSPERYMPGLTQTHQLYHLSFRWAFDKTYDPNNYR